MTLAVTCNTAGATFWTQDDANAFASQLFNKYIPSPGKSNALIDALQAAGLNRIVNCDLYVPPPTPPPAKTLLVAAAVSSTGVLWTMPLGTLERGVALCAT